MSMLVLVLVLISISAFLVRKAESTVETLSAHAASYPEEYVNILGGTDSRYDLSRGSTIPFIARPWGFNTYAPQTDNDPNYTGWWFHPYDRRFFGLRVTHQPSPWISDYGNFLIKGYMPYDVATSSSADDCSGYSPKSSVFSPYFFETTLQAYGTAEQSTKMEFTPTIHGGVMRMKFPKFDRDAAISGFVQTRRIAIVLNGGEDSTAVGKYDIDSTVMLSGFTTTNSGGVGNTETAAFAHYFVATIYGGPEGDVPLQLHGEHEYHADNNTVWVNFSPEERDHEVITVRFATSFISKEQAVINLQAEVSAENTFESLVEQAKSAWNDVLSRVRITSVLSAAPSSSSSSMSVEEQEVEAEAEAKKKVVTFYSSLYRASLFPRNLGEVDASNVGAGKHHTGGGGGSGQTAAEVHWSPYASTAEDRTASGPLTTDSGFWDAWNTVYPLLTLFHQPKLGEMIQGWCNAYKEGGWLPKWASPGYRGSMVGTMGDVSLADAIVNEIPGFPVEEAYAAIRKDAFEAPAVGSEGVGRECFDAYLQYGYVPRDAPKSTGAGLCDQVVARTLNYYQSDYAIAQAALKLGYTEDAQVLLKRASNFSAIFEQDGAFFRSRSVDSEKWTEPFDEFGWGGDYTEAGPWQYRFYVPYDAAGLAALYADSGRDMCSELERVHTMRLPTYHLGGYDSLLHEMTEFAEICWGQYAHNNQPIHHQLYMGMYAGYQSPCAANAQRRIRQVLDELYTPHADMFPGDEDNGEMGAWYVLSSLGLYNLSPGSGEFVFGSPQFGKVEVNVSPDVQSKKILHIVSENNSKDNVYVQKIMWNDEVVDGTASGIPFSKLKNGGTLTFYMGAEPVKN